MIVQIEIIFSEGQKKREMKMLIIRFTRFICEFILLC